MPDNNISTDFHPSNRVSFSMPVGGYTLDDLATLEAAIKHARRSLTEEPLEVVRSTEDLDALYAAQLERQAAPT